jgi:hypothetical protein
MIWPRRSPQASAEAGGGPVRSRIPAGPPSDTKEVGDAIAATLGSRDQVTAAGNIGSCRALRIRANCTVYPSLPQLADSVGLRLADQKPSGEVANLEQPPDFPDHAAKRELAPFLGRAPIGNEEHAKPGAAYIRYVLQIDHDRPLASLKQCDQSIAEFFCGRAVEPTMGLKDGDLIDYAFHQLHVGAPIVMPITSSPTATDMDRTSPDQRLMRRRILMDHTHNMTRPRRAQARL